MKVMELWAGSSLLRVACWRLRAEVSAGFVVGAGAVVCGLFSSVVTRWASSVTFVFSCCRVLAESDGKKATSDGKCSLYLATEGATRDGEQLSARATPHVMEPCSSIMCGTR